jgi:hypothetical protein
VAFGNSRSHLALSMAGRREVIRLIASNVDPTRTPIVSFSEASIRTRQTAERELRGFCGLRFAQ